MHKVALEIKARLSINDFIQSYLIVYENLFFDSWINDLNLIEENYYRSAIDLRNKFYTDIFLKMSHDVIGTHIWKNWKTYAVITVWNFRLFVYFTEEDNIRYIEDIEFFRK